MPADGPPTPEDTELLVAALRRVDREAPQPSAELLGLPLAQFFDWAVECALAWHAEGTKEATEAANLLFRRLMDMRPDTAAFMHTVTGVYLLRAARADHQTFALELRTLRERLIT